MKGKRRCRMHGGTNPGAPKGNKNALKHGAYTRDIIEKVRMVKALARFYRLTEID
ncbi:hypothetical protein [Sphingobium phenoxybenzoativorans]|uniref:hypothetical protein n=1 Tax=Sphingobium phenoxybenzoativorans TaxID=1592790 RepID=UPI003CCEE8D1